MRIILREIFRRGFGIRIKRILYGRKIKKISWIKRSMVKRHIWNGKSLQKCIFLRLVRWRIRIRHQGLSKIGRADEWRDMDGNNLSKKVRRGLEENWRTIKRRLFKRNIKRDLLVRVRIAKVEEAVKEKVVLTKKDDLFKLYYHLFSIIIRWYKLLNI